MVTSLEKSGKKVRINKIYANSFHWVKKCENRLRRSWDTFA